ASCHPPPVLPIPHPPRPPTSRPSAPPRRDDRIQHFRRRVPRVPHPERVFLAQQETQAARDQVGVRRIIRFHQRLHCKRRSFQLSGSTPPMKRRLAIEPPSCGAGAHAHPPEPPRRPT